MGTVGPPIEVACPTIRRHTPSRLFNVFGLDMSADLLNRCSLTKTFRVWEWELLKNKDLDIVLVLLRIAGGFKFVPDLSPV